MIISDKDILLLALAEVQDGQLGDGNRLFAWTDGECAAVRKNEVKVLQLVDVLYFGLQVGRGQTFFPRLSAKTEGLEFVQVRIQGNKGWDLRSVFSEWN